MKRKRSRIKEKTKKVKFSDACSNVFNIDGLLCIIFSYCHDNNWQFVCRHWKQIRKEFYTLCKICCTLYHTKRDYHTDFCIKESDIFRWIYPIIDWRKWVAMGQQIIDIKNGITLCISDIQLNVRSVRRTLNLFYIGDYDPKIDACELQNSILWLKGVKHFSMQCNTIPNKEKYFQFTCQVLHSHVPNHLLKNFGSIQYRICIHFNTKQKRIDQWMDVLIGNKNTPYSFIDGKYIWHDYALIPPLGLTPSNDGCRIYI